MSEPQDQDLEPRERELNRRLLIVAVDQNGEVEVEGEGDFAAWEVIGLSAWLDIWGRDLLNGEDDDV